jgi:outer membrane immunogenic protein
MDASDDGGFRISSCSPAREEKMKRTAFSLVFLSLALDAVAADLAGARKPAPPPPPSWEGFNVGVTGGYAWTNNPRISTTAMPLPTPGALVVPPGVPVPDATPFALATIGSLEGGAAGGFIGGGQLGYQKVFASRVTAGLEADIQGVVGAGGAAIAVTPSTEFHATTRLDYLATLRGKIGYLVTPDFLVYGTGGLAYGGMSSTMSILQPGVGLDGGSGRSGAFTARVGWSAGAGVEWMFLPNWSVKAEYLYYDLGSVGHSMYTLASGYDPLFLIDPTFQIETPFAYSRTRTLAHFSGQTVRAGVNYHFNWAPALLQNF